MREFIGAHCEIESNISLAEESSPMYIGEFSELWLGRVNLDVFATKVSEKTETEITELVSAKHAILAKLAIKELLVEQTNNDTEMAHSNADIILCELLKSLGFSEVVKQYHKVDKWYA